MPTNENIFNAGDSTFAALQKTMLAAQQELDMAVAFHEVWKPAAYDASLHKRLGVSYATQAFLVVRTALRREMLLALIRLWDSNKQALRIYSLVMTLKKEEMINALASERASSLGLSEVIDAVRDDLREKINDAVLLVEKYLMGGLAQLCL